MRIYAKDLINVLNGPLKGIVLYGNSEEVQDFVVWLYHIFFKTLDTPAVWEHTDGETFFSNPSVYTANLFSTSQQRRILVTHDVSDPVKAKIEGIQDVPLDPFVVLKGRNLKQSARLVKMGLDKKTWAAFACYDNVSLGLKKTFFKASLECQGVQLEDALMPLLWEEVPLALWPSVCEKLCILSEDGPISVATYKSLSEAREEVAFLKEIILMRQGEALKHFFTEVDLSTLMISVRIITNLFFKMLTIKDSLQKGGSADGAWTKLKPPIFFEDLALCKRAFDRWSCSDLKCALMAMGHFEKRLKEKHPFCFDSLMPLMESR